MGLSLDFRAGELCKPNSQKLLNKPLSMRLQPI